MALIGTLFNIEKLDTTAIAEFFKRLVDQPRWLLVLVAAAVIGAGIFFAVRRHQDGKTIDAMTEQVTEISRKVDESIGIETYIQNQIYVVSEIRLLQQAEEQMYDEQMLQLELLNEFIARRFPGDPVARDFDAMHSRLENNHRIYRQHYDYLMRHLDESIADSARTR